MKKLLFLFSFSVFSLWFLGCGAKPNSPQTTAQQQQQQNLQARTVYLKAHNLIGHISKLDVQVILPNNTQYLRGYDGPLTIKGYIQLSSNYGSAVSLSNNSCSSQINFSCSANISTSVIRSQNCSAVSRCCPNFSISLGPGQQLKETYSINYAGCF